MIDQFYHNKNILILGGSYGIGEALVKQLAKKGANLVIAARSIDKIHDLINSIEGKHYAIKCDVNNDHDWLNLSKELNKLFSTIDLIIFSVGTYKPMGFNDFNAEISEQILSVNLGSFVKFIDCFSESIKNAKIKHIAIISSIAGYFGMPNSMFYGASKAGLTNLVESLKYELLEYNVKVQLINPGFVKTRLTDQNKFTMPFIISVDKSAEIIIQKLKSRNFEIAFPNSFKFFMRVLRFLPHSIRFFIVKYAK